MDAPVPPLGPPTAGAGAPRPAAVPPAGGRPQALGLAFIVLAAVAWSTAGLFPRVLSTDMHTTLFWRSLLGGASVLVLQWLFFKPGQWSASFRLDRAEWTMALYNAVAMICFIAAFYFASVADVVFIYSTFPIITLMLSARMLQLPVHRLDLGCALVVMLGVALILGGQTSWRGAMGPLLSFVATIMFSLTTVGIKRHPQADMVKVTYVAGFLSALIMAPMATFAHWGHQGPIDLAWLWLYGFLNIGVGFGAFLLGVQRLKPVHASLLCMIEIPLAPIWAWLLFGETVSGSTLWGGVIILTAVLVAMAWPRQPDPLPAA